MRWGSRCAILLVLVTLSWLATIAELGVSIPPEETGNSRGDPATTWLPKAKYGLNHAVLAGDAYQRGLDYGMFTGDLLLRQEDALNRKIDELFPSKLSQLALRLFAKRWFWGMESWIEDEWKREMHGVSLSAPEKYDDRADPYTRQLAYHGVHEVGQMFVDFGGEGMACTVIAVPNGKGWLVGRNLDFEGGRIFDEEKIVKWVFPDAGIPFVHVIWAGMVGAVTGVNAKGVYVSINASGSSEFARLGTPSTLLITKALQHASSAGEAVEILRNGNTIITEAFVVTAPGSPLYVVEKSPKRTVVREEREATAVANHLVSPEWSGDKVNEFRKTGLTSHWRLARGLELAKSLADRRKKEPLGFEKHGPAWMAAALRDKHVDGMFAPGNRAAIDALIATHSVVYDSARGVIYVSTGPSLTGRFLGFDLAKSFARMAPVPAGDIPEDPFKPASYARARADIAAYERVVRELAEKTPCEELVKLKERATIHYARFLALGLLAEKCGVGDPAVHFRGALTFRPAYARERRLAEEHLKGSKK